MTGETPEMLVGAQSFTFDIRNEKDGKFGVMTFFTLPNAAQNPDNKVIARFAVPYEMLAAMPKFIDDLIARNDQMIRERAGNQ